VLARMGEVNLTAIEEFNQVNERYTFLTAQKEDLEQAIAALRAAIRRINSTSKERYMEAFRLVNEKFQLVFPRLFNGGSASLVMLDESDPLESGIEMLAQPPGKKLQSVNLLSGGEKALTAVSLIFSIFLIKPTPVLPPRRGRRAARRGERRPLQRHGQGHVGGLAVHPHHAQQADDGAARTASTA
jgi:chromosome segregation protein